LRDFQLFIRLRRKFKSIDPTHILSFTIKNNIYGAIAARGLDLQFIPNVTGLGTVFLSGRPKQALAEALYRFAFKNLQTVFFQNEDDAQLFKGRGLVNSHQMRLLPGSGIDLQKFSAAPIQNDEVTFLMIARLIREKGVAEYVEAAREINSLEKSIKFQLMGPIAEDNPSSISKDTLSDWTSDGSIEYLGAAADVRPHIAAASCIVLPSYREGAPRVLIEASAMARPSITTDVPGCRSVVEDTETGLLVKVRDVGSLRDGMLKFAQMDKADRRSLGLKARLKAEREFDESHVIHAYKAAMGMA
jgi:glycosyltransferase involved in cell wall biosynthesis